MLLPGQAPIARVSILWVLVTILLVTVPARPAIADQGAAAVKDADQPMPFEKGTVEISVLGGTSLPTALFRAKSDHQLALHHRGCTGQTQERLPVNRNLTDH